MGKKIDEFTSDVKEKTAKVVDDATDFLTREDDDAAEVINRANKFGLGKDVLPFALIGAAVAIPIPFIGPIIGGAIGAAIAVWRGNQRAEADDGVAGAIEATPTSVKSRAKPRNQDVVAELIRFGELRDKGLITQAEFDAQKARLLGEG
jgi:membrane protease subunit (stomatin/prohibitin family)